jgi:hypothetical protein
VALAFIKTEGLDEAGRARVEREARAMARLGDHPHIVTVYDIGDEDGRPYIVSQYMAGGDLRGLLREAAGHRLSLEQTLRIADQICQALEHAHQRGIVHRDLKPANVWLTEDGTCKLGDFGLAAVLDRSRLTMPGTMIGTVAYMAPEQALGHAPDARNDLYAVGAMLYEMVTGRPPFVADDAVGVISQHINTAPITPSWHNPDLPRALESLILRLLAKVPEERPASAEAVRAALAAISSVTTGVMSTAAAVIEDKPANPLDRLASGVFVGRREELGQLRAALDDAFSGRARLRMLVGEAGIGKSRTAEELATYARLRYAQVLVGRCYEGEGAPAYWPWVQVIRAYAYERDPIALRSELGSGAAEIAQVVSAVRERLPDLPAPSPLEPDQARFRLFESIASFFTHAAGAQPLVVILDDLHWADKPSLLLLQFIAREVRSARLLIVGTYRDVEVQRTHPLAEALAALRREPIYGRVLLRGLSEADVGALLAAFGASDLAGGFVHAIYRETEGNPFFIQEILRHLVEEGLISFEAGRWTSHIAPEQMGIPEGVRDVIGRRLSRLSEPCKRTLTVAASISPKGTLVPCRAICSG